jgi:hypothetical protein
MAAAAKLAGYPVSDVWEIGADHIHDAIDTYQDSRGGRDIYFPAEMDDASINALREQAFQRLMEANLSSEEILRLSRACLNIRKLQASLPTRAGILIASQREHQLEWSFRAELAKRYGPPDQNGCFPIESDATHSAWLLSKLQELETKQNEEPPAQAA